VPFTVNNVPVEVNPTSKVVVVNILPTATADAARLINTFLVPNASVVLALIVSVPGLKSTRLAPVKVIVPVPVPPVVTERNTVAGTAVMLKFAAVLVLIITASPAAGAPEGLQLEAVVQVPPVVVLNHVLVAAFIPPINTNVNASIKMNVLVKFFIIKQCLLILRKW
jgi:hypothetical protein